jgi:hypothetical protein
VRTWKGAPHQRSPSRESAPYRSGISLRQHVGPGVRIPFAPAASLQTVGPSRDPGQQQHTSAPLQDFGTQRCNVGAVDQFAKSLPALGDDALIDTYHQAWEDHRAAGAEGSDNLSKAHAKRLATEKAMRDRFPDYQGRYP